MRRLPLLALVLATALPAAAVSASAGSSEPPTVKVVDAGAEPREALRFALTPGVAQNSSLTFTTTVKQSGAVNQTVGPLRIRFGVAITVGDKDADGNVRLAISYPSFELLKGSDVGSASQRDDVQRKLESFNGTTGELMMTPTGAVVSSAFELPETADPSANDLIDQLSEQANQLAIPLPDEPIGIGARWQATTQLELNGIRLEQTYTYTLRKRDGDRLDVDVRYVQRAPRQEADLPNVPAGTTVRVTLFKIAGKGTQTFFLSQPLPAEGRIKASGSQKLEFDRGGNTEKLSQDLSVALSVKAAT